MPVTWSVGTDNTIAEMEGTPTATYSLLIVKEQDQVVRVTMNRPEKLNAYNAKRNSGVP